MNRACPNALSLGTQIDKYIIQDVIGVGGFGITYLARDTSPLNRAVAIKECFPSDFVRRRDDCSVSPLSSSDHDVYRWCIGQFLNEARILANIHHPNVVTVHDCFEANGSAYMITAFVPGSTLETHLAQLGASPSPAFLANLLARLLAGVDAIHARQILHRDIKPENILIDGMNEPVLIDFGSARQAIGARSHSINVIVTPGYAPFEQYHTNGNQGPWTDLYALGAICYRAIHGEKPPEAPRRERQDTIVSLTQSYRGDYDPNFLAAIDKSLLKDENLRFQNAREWLSTLHRGRSEFHSLDSSHPLPRFEQPVSPPQQQASDIFPPIPPQSDHSMNTTRLASIPARFIAMLLDSIILYIPCGVIGVLMGVIFINNPPAAAVTSILLAVLCSIFYYSLTEASSWRASLGKRIMQLQVVRENGKKMTFSQASGRAAAKTFLPFFSHFFALFTDKNQALHDILAKTYVVKASTSLEVEVRGDNSQLTRAAQPQPASSPAAARWRLEGRDPATGRNYHFEWDEHTRPTPVLGRSATDADFCVENETVSRQHARFRCADGLLLITDLRSSNGTRKNNAPLSPHQEVVIAEGDTLTFGQVSLTLRKK